MEQQIKFNPAGSYKWNDDAKFTFDGVQFSTLINSMRNILNSPLGQVVLLAVEADKVLTKTLEDNVLKGVAVEFTTPPLPPTSQN